MSASRIATVVLLIVSASACSEALAPPESSETRPVSVFAALHENGRGVFEQFGVFSPPCLGEPISLHLVIPYTFHSTVTPSGNRIFTDQVDHEATTGVVVGMTTGRVWMFDRGSGPEAIRVTAGEGIAVVAISWFVRDGGPDFRIFSSYHLTQNANGEITTERLTLTCREF